MIVEELVAALGVEVDQNAIAKMTQAFNTFATGALGVAAAVGAAFVGVAGAVYKTAESGDELTATAEKLGLTTSALQELNYVTLLTDTNAESLAKGMGFLGKAASEAALKGGEAAEAFSGISLKENGKIKDLDVLLGDVAEKVSGMPDAASKIDLAMKVFGKAGKDLIPMLNKGRDGIAAFRKEAQDTGFVMSEETVAAGAAFDDSLKRLNARLLGFRNRLAGPLIEKFTKLLDRMGAAFGKQGGILSTFVKVFGGLLDGVNWLLEHGAAVKALLVTVAAGFIAWGAAALVAASGTGALGAAAITAAIAAGAAWIAAALPFILFGAAVALVADDLYEFATGGRSVLGDLLNWFQKFDPTDSPLIKLLREAGGLLFNLTEPTRWVKFGKALADFLLQPLRDVTTIVNGILGALGSKLVLPTVGSASSLGDAAVAAFPMLGGFVPSGETTTDWRQKAPALPAPVTGFSNQTTPGPVQVATTINLTVPPGTDAAGVAGAVSKAVDERLGVHLRTASKATGSFQK